MSATTENELDPKQLNLWKKALLANDQRNWDYVVSLALPVVKANPLFMQARVLIRRAEGELFKTQKKGLFGGSGVSMGFKSGAKKDPWEVLAELEENVFQKDPFNIKANQEFYDVAMRAGYPDLAAFGLETIRLGHPTNTKLAHTLAEHYMANDQPDKAGETYSSILKVDPRDMVAIKGEKDSAARMSIKQGGWNQGFDKAKKDSAESMKLERRNKQGMTREQMEEYLQDLSAEYEAEPTNINVVKDLADLLERMDDLNGALGFYRYALELNSADVAMARKIEILQDKIDDLAISRLETEIESNPDAPDIEERRAELADIKRHRGQKAIEEAKGRVDRNPTDKAYRFDLGQAYFNAGMYGEAIPELQQARQNPSLRTKALLMLGRCFERKNMNDLGINALADCVKELPTMDSIKKEALYELAMVYEKVGKKAEYLECLKEIYNNDYGYRDVAHRVESSYT